MQCPRTAVLVVTAGVVAFTGCGSSAKLSSSTRSTAASKPAAITTPVTTSSKPLTQEQLITKADAICYQLNARRAAKVYKSPRDYVRMVPQVAAYDRTAAAELAKLTPPASMATDWQTILFNANAVAQYTSKLNPYILGNPHLERGYPLAKQIAQAENQLIAVALRDGFKDCAEA